jgi:hypothetical protein
VRVDDPIGREIANSVVDFERSDIVWQKIARCHGTDDEYWSTTPVLQGIIVGSNHLIVGFLLTFIDPLFWILKLFFTTINIIATVGMVDSTIEARIQTAIIALRERGCFSIAVAHRAFNVP